MFCYLCTVSVFSFLLQKSCIYPSHPHFHFFHYCSHIHNTINPVTITLTLLTITHKSINIHTLYVIKKLTTLILYSQHLPQSFPINHIICLLKFHKTYIHTLFLLLCFHTYLPKSDDLICTPTTPSFETPLLINN